jgi:hypothetical protein
MSLFVITISQKEKTKNLIPLGFKEVGKLQQHKSFPGFLGVGGDDCNEF